MKQDLKNILESYLSIYYEQDSVLIQRRTKEERQKNYKIALSKQIQDYIKNGSEGDLDLRSTPITTLPDGLSVGGSLNLSDTPITTLPDGLSVGGSLFLSDTPITKLPDGLRVDGYLDLQGTQITTLPDGLSVGGSLNLNFTQITTLPNDLRVDRDLALSNTPISKKYTKEQIRKMYPGVKGQIYI